MTRKIKFIQSCGLLPKIVLEHSEQLYYLGLKIGILFSSVEAMNFMDRFLWTNKQLSFIPHATSNDADSDLQPIYLTTCPEFPNFPNVLLCVDCVSTKTICDEEIIIFSSDSKSLASIRDYYKAAQGSQNEVNFSRE
jgi:DNA polymerase IIIc chi subunit